VNEDRLLQVLDEVVHAVRGALDELADWGPAGTRPGQYRLDLAADAAALPILHGAGLGVLSEESGTTGDPAAPLLAVIDPVDGSTNAHRGIPFYATSICVLDAEGPLVGVVVNQATGTHYQAVRGGGARRDGQSIAPSGCTDLSTAIVGISGFPRIHPGWAQFRALGAAALEFCAVAEGTLDAYTVVGKSTLFGWDYLAGMLICSEVKAVTLERDGAEVVVRDSGRRRPVVGATPQLAEVLLAKNEL
jgi:fructose-1,6-bisphosphatase/inositol monophosphatase family enzyme